MTLFQYTDSLPMTAPRKDITSIIEFFDELSLIVVSHPLLAATWPADCQSPSISKFDLILFLVILERDNVLLSGCQIDEDAVVD